jgi:hypothetical protein
MTYCALFGVGKLLFGHYLLGTFLALLSASSASLLSRELTRDNQTRT